VRHLHVVKAARRFLKDNGPSTSKKICEEMTFNNGKRVQLSQFSVSATELASILRTNPEFEIHERRYSGGFLWALKML